MNFESYEDYVKYFTENGTKFIQSISCDSEIYEIRDVGAHLRIDELEKELSKRLRTYKIGIFIFTLIRILILVTLVFVLSLAYTNLNSKVDDLPQRNEYTKI
jgi:hypothetical protein